MKWSIHLYPMNLFEQFQQNNDILENWVCWCCGSPLVMRGTKSFQQQENEIKYNQFNAVIQTHYNFWNEWHTLLILRTTIYFLNKTNCVYLTFRTDLICQLFSIDWLVISRLNKSNKQKLCNLNCGKSIRNMTLNLQNCDALAFLRSIFKRFVWNRHML